MKRGERGKNDKKRKRKGETQRIGERIEMKTYVYMVEKRKDVNTCGK